MAGWVHTRAMRWKRNESSGGQALGGLGYTGIWQMALNCSRTECYLGVAFPGDPQDVGLLTQLQLPHVSCLTSSGVHPCAHEQALSRLLPFQMALYLLLCSPALTLTVIWQSACQPTRGSGVFFQRCPQFTQQSSWVRCLGAVACEKEGALSVLPEATRVALLPSKPTQHPVLSCMARVSA